MQGAEPGFAAVACCRAHAHGAGWRQRGASSAAAYCWRSRDRRGLRQDRCRLRGAEDRRARPGLTPTARKVTPMQPRHFLDIDALPRQTLRAILDDAHAMKAAGRGRLQEKTKVRPGAVLAMIFEKPSTRTRVSFEVAMHELGGSSIVLDPQDMQLGRGETVADTARVLSRYVDAIMLRTGPQETLTELAAHASVPVINGLTDRKS